MFPLKEIYTIITSYLLSTPSSPAVIFTGKGTICSSKANSSGLFAYVQEEASRLAAVSAFYFLENWFLGMRSGTARDAWTLFWGPVLFLSTICMWSAHGEGKPGLCLIFLMRKFLHMSVQSCFIETLSQSFQSPRGVDGLTKHDFTCMRCFRSSGIQKGLVTHVPVY